MVEHFIQENADPSAKRDLERWLERLVPDGDPFYSHDTECPDDMPGRIQAALTATSLPVPIRSRGARGHWARGRGSICGNIAGAARGGNSSCTSARDEMTPI